VSRIFFDAHVGGNPHRHLIDLISLITKLKYNNYENRMAVYSPRENKTKTQKKTSYVTTENKSTMSLYPASAAN